MQSINYDHVFLFPYLKSTSELFRRRVLKKQVCLVFRMSQVRKPCSRSTRHWRSLLMISKTRSKHVQTQQRNCWKLTTQTGKINLLLSFPSGIVKKQFIWSQTQVNWLQLGLLFNWLIDGSTDFKLFIND